MDSTIRESYVTLSKLLYDVNKIVYYFRINNFDKALRLSKTMIERISLLLEHVLSNQTYLSDYILNDQENMQMMLQNLMFAQESADYVLLADLYELQLADWLRKGQECIVTREECSIEPDNIQTAIESITDSELRKSLKAYKPDDFMQAGYHMEFTSAGEPTLYKSTGQGGYYFHSNVSPKWEAFLLAESWYSEEIEQYHVYGLGLGYTVCALLEKTPFVEVVVWESDLNVIYAALSVTDLNAYLQDGRLKIVYDPAYKNISSNLGKRKEGVRFVIHYPSMNNIDNVTIKEAMENYFIQYNSIKNQQALLDGNFRKNIKHNHPSVDSLRKNFENKKAYIVAAGPSLDKNFMQLKDVKDGIIIATGTVLKKLVKAEITPDYVIVTDANPRVYRQIKGIEECSIPMIYLSTANYKFAKEYKGDKYIACQSGYDEAEELAKEKGYMLFETGGSVTTAALDICVSLGCSDVIFLGLDLAYPDGYVHAADTSRRELSSTNGLRSVLDINGETVKTSKSLAIYKKWIEEYIKRNTHVRFIDATEGGAKIEGTTIKRFRDLL